MVVFALLQRRHRFGGRLLFGSRTTASRVDDIRRFDVDTGLAAVRRPFRVDATWPSRVDAMICFGAVFVGFAVIIFIDYHSLF